MMSTGPALAVFGLLALVGVSPAFAQSKAVDRPAAAPAPPRPGGPAAPEKSVPKAPDGSAGEKAAAIRRLLVLTGSGQLGVQVMGQMIGSLKATMPKVPEAFWIDFMREVDPTELIEMVVPIYDRHLSMAEVKDLVRFYETPTGRKMAGVMPLITQESMEAGRRWGQQLGERVARRLREQGHSPEAPRQR